MKVRWPMWRRRDNGHAARDRAERLYSQARERRPVVDRAADRIKDLTPEEFADRMSRTFGRLT